MNASGRPLDVDGGRGRRRHRIERLQGTSESWLIGLLATTVAGSMLAVGSVHVPSVLAVATMAVLVAAQAVRIRLATTNADRLPGPFFVLVALGGYTLLQAMPLPITWVQAISPSTADVWQRTLLPFREPAPHWASLSLDPGASLIEAVKWFTYAAVFVGASAIGLIRGAAPNLAIAFGSGLLAAVATLGHGLLGATRVFGIYEPRFGASPWHVGPLLNPNNLAGYLNLAVFCGLGLLLTPNLPLPPWFFGIGIATIVGVSVTAASRAGVLALLVGLLLYTGMLIRSRKQREVSSATVASLIGATVVGGAAFALLGSTGQTWQELYTTNAEKIEMLVWAKPMIADHPLFGIGRGAFESVFPAYRTTPGHVVFSHAENFPGQWLAEWGIPVTLAAAGALLWYFRPRRTRRTDVSLIAGAWTGVAVLLLQNLFDLGLEVASVCIALSLVLGAIWGNRERATAKITRKVVAPVRRRWQLAIVLTGVTVVTVAAFQGWHDLASDRQAAHVLVDDVRTPQTRLKLSSLLHAAMLRHPAEPYFPLVGAIAAHQAKENPVPWVERALERALLNPRAHFFLGEVLGATNHVPQALLELRIAVQQEPDLAAYAATAALRWTKELEYLLIAIPDGQSGASLLEQIAAQLADQDDPLRTTLLQQALHRSPRSSGVHLALAEVLLRELRRPESLTCAAEKRKTCEEEIERHATFVETALPNASPAARLRAMLLVERGDAERAEALLADRCRSMSDKIACARAWVQVAAHIKQPERLLVAAHELIAVACSGTSECAEALTWLGDLMGERREWGGALTYYARAVREQPTENRWLRVADASSHVGAYAEEAAALERVAQLRGQMDASLKTRIDESRARMILH